MTSAAEARSLARMPPQPTVRALDVIGDVHGCLPELLDLLRALGYGVDGPLLTPPSLRQLVFAGDLVDRGPDVPGVLRLVMGAVRAGKASCVLGNHDDKLRRVLNGEDVAISAGRAVSLRQLTGESAAFREEVREFLEGLPPRLSFLAGQVLVVHAGERAELPDPQRAHHNVYGADGGVPGPFGYKERDDWAADYTGAALVVSGHTPTLAPLWRGNTVNIDTGCVFGGRLTALRLPEREAVSVPARRAYAQSLRFSALRH